MSSPRNRRQIVERRDTNGHSNGFHRCTRQKTLQDGRLEGSEGQRCPMPVLRGTQQITHPWAPTNRQTASKVQPEQLVVILVEASTRNHFSTATAQDLVSSLLDACWLQAKIVSSETRFQLPTRPVIRVQKAVEVKIVEDIRSLQTTEVQIEGLIGEIGVSKRTSSWHWIWRWNLLLILWNRRVRRRCGIRIGSPPGSSCQSSFSRTSKCVWMHRRDGCGWSRSRGTVSFG